MRCDSGLRKGLIAPVLLALGVIMAGCGGAGGSGSGHQRAAGLGGRLLKDKADILRLKDQIIQTNAALNDIITDPQRDLKPQFKAFSSAVKKLDSMVKKARERTVAIQASLDKYIDTWRDDVVGIQDPTLREQAISRVTQAKESFQRLYAELTGTKEVLTPYVGSLKDIQRYLDTDLTPAGLKTIKPLADKAMGSQNQVLQRLDALAAELERVAAELAAGQRKAGS